MAEVQKNNDALLLSGADAILVGDLIYGFAVEAQRNCGGFVSSQREAMRAKGFEEEKINWLVNIAGHLVSGHSVLREPAHV